MKFSAVSALFAGLSLMTGAQTRPLRPPITGIAQVSVYDSNPLQAQSFYAGLLGLPRMGRNPGTGGSVYQVSSLQSIEVDPLPKGQADDLESITFATANVEQLRLYLLDSHVQIPGRVQTRRDGSRSLSLVDPEGHRIVFVDAGTRPHRIVSSRHADRDPVSTHILHAGFIVHDRAAEDHFFRDVLGFREGWQGGMKDNQIDWVDMQVPDGTDWIEYMIHGPGPVSAAESGVLNHFALGVPNMHEAMELLEQHGWHASPRQDAQIGRDGKWQLNLYDPNRTRVELMEFRLVEIPCCSPYSLSVTTKFPESGLTSRNPVHFASYMSRSASIKLTVMHSSAILESQV